MKDYSFVNRADYFAAITEGALAARAGETVVVAAMDFDPAEPTIARLMVALQGAAQRGARVILLIDAHNFLSDDRNLPGPLFYHHSLDGVRGSYALAVAALKGLETAGGAYCITNVPRRRFSLPVGGRSHIKGAVIGSRIFVGGCNLHKPSDIDVMVTWQNELAAATLRQWLLSIARNGHTRVAFNDVDSEATLDIQTSLLIDAGVPHQSLIYDEALRLIDEAQEWLYITCQYFPGGPTAKHLAAAQKRGVRVEIDYNHPRNHGTLAALHHLHQLSQHTKRLPRNFFTGKLGKHVAKLHAKVLASERGALVGSHNYVIQGVTFGTAELALRSNDPSFALALRSFIKSQIAQADPMITQAEARQEMIKNGAEVSHSYE